MDVGRARRAASGTFSRAAAALELLDGTPSAPEAVKTNWPVFESRVVRAYALQALGNHAAAVEELDACNATYFAGVRPAWGPRLSAPFRTTPSGTPS